MYVYMFVCMYVCMYYVCMNESINDPQFTQD